MSNESGNFTTRFEPSIAHALRTYCREEGLIINRFIQDAVIEKLQDVADLDEIASSKKSKENCKVNTFSCRKSFPSRLQEVIC